MPALFSLALGKSLDLLSTVLGPGPLAALLIVAAAAVGLYRRRSATVEPPRVRQFTLLRTQDADGSTVRYETTQPPGTKIQPWVGGHQRLYELTGVRLEDGTYAAEPLDEH